MKYPLSIVEKLIDTYGKNLLVGYDIGCAFSTTVERSGLAEKARSEHLAHVVPAFHGHAHNRGCQVNFHPMYKKGAGKEDFETCERVFSGSNGLAPGTRLSSTFHRIQALEEYFAHWSFEKDAEKGTVYFNND